MNCVTYLGVDGQLKNATLVEGTDPSDLNWLRYDELEKRWVERGVVMVSGPTDFTQEQFDTYYVPKLTKYVEQGMRFVVGGASGVDRMCQEFLISQGYDPSRVTVYDKSSQDNRLDQRFGHVNGFKSYPDRDAAMTRDSHVDLVTVHQYGGGGSGAFANVVRREYGDEVAMGVQQLFRNHATPFDMSARK